MKPANPCGCTHTHTHTHTHTQLSLIEENTKAIINDSFDLMHINFVSRVIKLF